MSQIAYVTPRREGSSAKPDLVHVLAALAWALGHPDHHKIEERDGELFISPMDSTAGHRR